MPWFGIAGRSHRASAKRAQQFEPADRVVVSAFVLLRQVRYLQCRQLPEMSPRVAEQLERRVWERLIEYLVKLPMPNDD